MSSKRNLRRRALCMAMGMCLASMASAPVFAQSATGAVVGRADAGAQVTISNPQTGYTRTVTASEDGSYRLALLPPGTYLVQSGSGEPIQVGVTLGNATTVNLASSATTLGTIEVVGSRVINAVDVPSTESATTLTAQEIARMPVERNVSSVALLAPGVAGGSASFGGISFGGSSVAENAF